VDEIYCLGSRAEASSPTEMSEVSNPLSLSLGMVDVIFADVAQPDQTRIVALNAHNFLKNGGNFVISIKVRRSSLNKVTEGGLTFMVDRYCLLVFSF